MLFGRFRQSSNDQHIFLLYLRACGANDRFLGPRRGADLNRILAVLEEGGAGMFGFRIRKVMVVVGLQ